MLSAQDFRNKINKINESIIDERKNKNIRNANISPDIEKKIALEQWTISLFDNINKNNLYSQCHDISSSFNPLLGIFSLSSVNVNNSQAIEFYHQNITPLLINNGYNCRYVNGVISIS
jgi:hypothetical protein